MQRRVPQSGIHPGQQCGPCYLCGQSSKYFTHPLAWEETIKSKLLQIDNIDEVSCVCKACEMNIKRHIKEENYQPRWRTRASKKCDECIAPACNTTHGIIHTALITPQ